MQDQLSRKLHAITVSTFEQLVFMFETPERDDDQDGVGEAEGIAALEFSGPFSGRLVIKSYDGLLQSLAANMLGESEQTSEQVSRDALGEIANVIGGNILAAIEPDIAFILHPPKWEGTCLSVPQELNKTAEMQAFFDEGRVEVQLYVEQLEMTVTEHQA